MSCTCGQFNTQAIQLSVSMMGLESGGTLSGPPQNQGPRISHTTLLKLIVTPSLRDLDLCTPMHTYARHP